MPRISTFVYSDSVNNETAPNGNRLVSIQNPMLVFRPVFIPSLFSFAVTVGIVGVGHSETHTIRFTFGKIGGEELLIDTGVMPLPANLELDENGALPVDHRGFLFNMDFRNVVFHSEGEYESNTYFDGVLLGTHPVYVKGAESRGI
ncbi:hypothetical protein NSQ91_09135 [Paenibacillus sp. FSL R7-0048]|uniref:hypothetical protein n=1 Tax=Paenibacillus TaxID=44249 RepID=UPI00096CA627|nr:hypothetical protein [Paenibacillus odorifer]OMD73379.1 hypothetical protein BSK48_05815 [Paenibacillus odorifer]